MKNSVLQKLSKNKVAIGALFILSVLVLLTIGAECIAPYHFDADDRVNPYHPPTKLHFYNEGQIHFIPFVHAYTSNLNDFHQRVYTEDISKKYPLKLFVHGQSYRLWGLFESDIHLFGVAAPATIHLFGTDGRGRDLFARIVMGGRISFSIGIVGVIIAMVLGTIIGGIAGYFGGKIDQIIMRFAELFMMIPTFYLLLAIRSSLPPHLSSFQVYLLVTCILSCIGWASLARVIRGMVLTLREQDYVQVARLMGSSHLSIIVRHILPHTTSYLLVVISIAIPGYILAESGLSFLGLGIQEPFVSWGMLLSEAVSITQLKFHPWVLMPGMFLFVTILSFNVLGDALRDILDPHVQVGK